MVWSRRRRPSLEGGSTSNMDANEARSARSKRIDELERRRAAELESRRWMASRPNRPNSYRKEELFERNVNERYDAMVDAVQRDATSCGSTGAVSLEGRYGYRRPRKQRKTSFPRRDEEGDSHASDNSCIDEDEDGDEDGESVALDENHDEDDSAQDVIVIDDSGSDSDVSSEKSRFSGGSADSDSDKECRARPEDSNSSSGESHDASSAAESSTRSHTGDETDRTNDDEGGGNDRDGDSNETTEGRAEGDAWSLDDSFFAPDHNYSDKDGAENGNECLGCSNTREPDRNRSDKDNAEDDNGSDDEGEDEDDASGDIERYHVSKLKTSKLFMATQGFRCPRSADRSEGDRESNRASDRAKDYSPFDPSSVKYRGRVFRKNRCYVTVGSEGEVAVGIEHFLPNDTARCILVRRFENTLLGIEDEGSGYEADGGTKGTHVKIHQCYKNLTLSKLGRECEDVAEIPRLIYQPQSDGDWHTFGYFHDRTRMRRKGKRQGMRSLELFAGAGGSLLGYKHSGFETVMAVENNADAVRTLKENNEGIHVYEGCIKQFLRDYDTLKCALGRIDHVHFSSPCQDFSKANRSQNRQNVGKRDRADLSLLLIDLVEKTSCSTAVFENVVGIWDRKNVHYLKNIAAGMMKLGYQVRCTKLEACDYGDPQKRPRVIMLVSKNAVPIPSFPAKTHGDDPDLFPYVTVKDALSSVTGDGSLPNLEGCATSLRPGQHGSFRLMPNDVARTIRASTSGVPFHYSEDRCINVREAASLQSFPSRYVFRGSIVSQYRQIGNAVPVELSTAIAQCIRQVLLYEYEEMDEE